MGDNRWGFTHRPIQSIWYVRTWRFPHVASYTVYTVESASSLLMAWCLAPSVISMMTSSNGNISALLALRMGNSRSLVDSPHRSQWRGALVFSLTCAWTNGCANNLDVDDLWRHRAHYDITVIFQRIPATYDKEINPSLSKPSLKFNSSLYKIGLTSFAKQGTGKPQRCDVDKKLFYNDTEKVINQSKYKKTCAVFIFPRRECLIWLQFITYFPQTHFVFHAVHVIEWLTILSVILKYWQKFMSPRC